MMGRSSEPPRGEHSESQGLEPKGEIVPPSAGKEIETTGGMSCLEHWSIRVSWDLLRLGELSFGEGDADGLFGNRLGGGSSRCLPAR